jgi:tRNA-splicing ligase RtcB
MVDVVQLAEHRVVTPEAAGSIPAVHPTISSPRQIGALANDQSPQVQTTKKARLLKQPNESDGNECAKAPVATWLSERMPEPVSRAIAKLATCDDVVKIAVMPDVHLAADVCNGVAVATRQRLYPQAVGGDIGCGMTALRLDGSAGLLRSRHQAQQILKGLETAVPIERHSRATVADELPGDLRDQPLSDPAMALQAARTGLFQLGTLGRGNHFLEIQADDQDQLWLMVHSGSRGLGQAIAMRHLARAEDSGRGLRSLEAGSDEGRAYLNDMDWAVRYASRSRLAMARAAARLLEAVIGAPAIEDSLVDTPHNLVRQENVAGQQRWIHRKGAMGAREGEPGVIPGAMGAISYHVTGRGSEDALNSCSHGAGRAMSRTEARRRITRRDFERQVGDLWYDERRANDLREESPGAYKDLRLVMKAQADLVRIDRRLRGVLTYKGI